MAFPFLLAHTCFECKRSRHSPPAREQETQIQQQNSQILQATESQTNQEIAIEGKLVAYTMLLVIVGALQVAVLFLMVRVINRQTSAAKDSQRTWVIVSPTEGTPQIRFIPESGDALDAPGRDQRNAFICSFKSTGDTPARLVDSAVVYRLVNRLEDIPDEPEYGQRGPFNDLALVNGDSIGAIAFPQPTSSCLRRRHLLLREKRLFCTPMESSTTEAFLVAVTKVDSVMFITSHRVATRDRVVFTGRACRQPTTEQLSDPGSSTP